jgi:hypothetical protein
MVLINSLKSGECCMAISKIREDAFGDGVWELFTEQIDTYFGEEWEDNFGERSAVLKTLISDLKKVEIKHNGGYLAINTYDWHGATRESPFDIWKIAAWGPPVNPSIFRLNCALMVPEGCNILPSQKVEFELSPYLLGDPFARAFDRYYGHVTPDPSDSDWLEPPGDQAIDRVYLEPRPLEFEHGVIPESDFLLDHGIYLIHTSLGEAVMLNGYRELLNSLEDFIPLTNDLWQKYLDVALACIESLESWTEK